MNDNGADVIGMRLELRDLFACIVVVDSDLTVSQLVSSSRSYKTQSRSRCSIQIIRPADNPVLPRNEAAGTDGDIGEFEGLYDLLGLV